MHAEARGDDRRRTLAKILGFFVLGYLALTFLPPVLWRLVPDHALIRGPAKGSAVAVLWLLLLTHLFLRSDGETLAAVGVERRRRRLGELAVGIAGGVLMSAAAALLLARLFRFEWHLNPRVDAGVVLLGLLLNCWSVLAEELLYRGYAFRAAIRRFGTWPSTPAFVSLFAMSHWAAWGAWGSGSRMLSVFATVALGGLLFSLAFVRTQSLALPVGLHLGFVWSNADLFTRTYARWYDNEQGLLYPVGTTYYDQAARDGWLLPELPYFVVVTLAIGALYAMSRGSGRGDGGRRPQDTAATVAEPELGRREREGPPGPER